MEQNLKSPERKLAPFILSLLYFNLVLSLLVATRTRYFRYMYNNKQTIQTKACPFFQVEITGKLSTKRDIVATDRKKWKTLVAADVILGHKEDIAILIDFARNDTLLKILNTLGIPIRYFCATSSVHLSLLLQHIVRVLFILTC